MRCLGSSRSDVNITVADMTNEGDEHEVGAEHSCAKVKGRTFVHPFFHAVDRVPIKHHC